MAYEPLHHKYRPQTFADLVGQEAIAKTLVSAIKQDRIAPAYLFTGARGTGKTSSARIMAKSLNCISFSAPTPTPCGKCELCTSISRSNALDITEIDAASNTGVDNIRELIERAQFAPVQARYKVYIIDEVHMLSNAAFNALLKTLEEPPNHVVFILATTDPQRVLPTIISRCQKFDFRRIPIDSLVNHLHKIAQIEKIDIDAEAVMLVGQMSQGGLRDAESLLDQLSLLEGEITVDAVWDLVGSVPERDLLSLLEAIATHNSTLIIEQLRHIMDRGREPLIVLQNLAGLYRDLLIAYSAPERGDLIALTSSGWEKLKQLAQSFQLEYILAAQQNLRSAEVQIKNTTQPRLWLEITVLGLLSLHADLQNAPKPQNGNLPDRVQPLGTPKLSIAPSPPASIAPTTVADIPAHPSGKPIDKSIDKPIEMLESDLDLKSPLANIPQFTNSEIPEKPDKPEIVARVENNAEKQSPAPVSLSTTPAVNLESAWRELMSVLLPATRGLLEQHGMFLDVNQTTIKIGIKHSPLKKIAEQKRDAIAQSCQQVFKRPMQVVFEVVDINNFKGNSLESSSFKHTEPLTQATTTSANAIAPAYNSAKEPPIVTSSTLARSDLPVESKTANVSPTSSKIPEDIAVKNVADFFSGQIIDLDT